MQRSPKILPSKSTESRSIRQTHTELIQLLNCEPYAPLTSVISSVGLRCHRLIGVSWVITMIRKLLSLSFELHARSLPACLLSDVDGGGSQWALSREGSPVELLISGGVEDRFSHLDIMPLVGPNPSRASLPFVLGALVRGPALFVVLNCQ